MNYDSLSKEEKDTFHKIKSAFDPISDEVALEYTQVAIQLAKAGEMTHMSAREVGEALKRISSNV